MSEPSSSRDNLRIAWERIKFNVGVVLGERVVFAGVNLLATVIATRTVGLEALGAVGLLFAFSRLITDVISVKIGSALLTYGAVLKEDGDRLTLRRLFGLAIWLDLAAIVLALAAANVGIVWFGEALGWTPEMIAIAPWFCLIAIFHVPSAGRATLRLYNRVPVIAAQHAIVATMRLLGVTAIWFFGGGMAELALVWATATVVAGTTIHIIAWNTAVGDAARPRMKTALRQRAKGFDRFWEFVLTVNATSIISGAMTHSAPLIVGAIAGPAGAGVFHVVRQITETLTRPGQLLSPLFFPEIAILEAKKDRRNMRRLVKRALIFTGAILAVAMAVIVVGGKVFLSTLFGPEAAEGYALLIAMSAGAAFEVWGFAIGPTILTLRKTRFAMASTFAAASIFALLAWLLSDEYGFVGVGLALAAAKGASFLMGLAMVSRLLAKSRV